MNEPGFQHGIARSAATLTGLLLLLAGGCARTPLGSDLRLVSYKDPLFPETYRVSFTDCTYRQCPRGDYQIVARSTHGLKGAAGPVTQYVCLDVYWKPHPGKTFSNRTGTDATLRYVIVSDTGVSAYTGSGFVFPSQRKFPAALIAQLETGRLRPGAQTGHPPEILGEARITGDLVAKNDPHRAVDLLREMELLAAGAVRK
jgi:hypothetical protein